MDIFGDFINPTRRERRKRKAKKDKEIPCPPSTKAAKGPERQTIPVTVEACPPVVTSPITKEPTQEECICIAEEPLTETICITTKEIQPPIKNSPISSMDIQTCCFPKSSADLIGNSEARSKLAGWLAAKKDRRSAKVACFVSGPAGCGKSVAIQILAKEHGFQLLEVNRSVRLEDKDTGANLVEWLRIQSRRSFPDPVLLLVEDAEAVLGALKASQLSELTKFLGSKDTLTWPIVFVGDRRLEKAYWELERLGEAVRFYEVPDSSIACLLTTIVRSLHLDVSANVLHVIAGRAHGDLRNALLSLEWESMCKTDSVSTSGRDAATGIFDLVQALLYTPKSPVEHKQTAVIISPSAAPTDGKIRLRPLPVSPPKFPRPALVPKRANSRPKGSLLGAGEAISLFRSDPVTCRNFLHSNALHLFDCDAPLESVALFAENFSYADSMGPLYLEDHIETQAVLFGWSAHVCKPADAKKTHKLYYPHEQFLDTLVCQNRSSLLRSIAVKLSTTGILVEEYGLLCSILQERLSQYNQICTEFYALRDDIVHTDTLRSLYSRWDAGTESVPTTCSEWMEFCRRALIIISNWFRPLTTKELTHVRTPTAPFLNFQTQKCQSLPYHDVMETLSKKSAPKRTLLPVGKGLEALDDLLLGHSYKDDMPFFPGAKRQKTKTTSQPVEVVTGAKKTRTTRSKAATSKKAAKTDAPPKRSRGARKAK